MQKAKVLYDAIAASNGFYSSPVDPAVRSLMNVPFTIPSNPDLEKTFIAEAAKLGMVRCSSSVFVACPQAAHAALGFALSAARSTLTPSSASLCSHCYC